MAHFNTAVCSTTAAAPFSDWPDLPAKPISPFLQATYIEAVDIALRYFNSGRRGNSVSQIARDARVWASRYFGCAEADLVRRRSLGLLAVHPDLFNLDLTGRLRLGVAQEPNPAAYSSAREAQEQGGHNTNTTEPFPTYMEPTLATAAELELIVAYNNKTWNRPVAWHAAPVTTRDLRASIVSEHLPAFLAQLATTDLELETGIAKKQLSDPDRDAVRAAREKSASSASVSSVSSSRSLRLASGSIIDLDAPASVPAPPTPALSFSSRTSASSRTSLRPATPGSPGPIRLMLPPLRDPCGSESGDDLPASPCSSASSSASSSSSPCASKGSSSSVSSVSSGTSAGSEKSTRRLIKIKVPEHMRANKRIAAVVAASGRLPTPPASPTTTRVASPGRIILKVPVHMRSPTRPGEKRRSSDDDDDDETVGLALPPAKRIKLVTRTAR